MRHPLLLCATIALLLGGVPGPAHGGDGTLAITPFHTFNQSPLVQIFGLPAAESAIVEGPGHARALVALDVANNYASHETEREKIILDGEGYRVTLALRRGIGSDLELGFDLPLVGYYGGVFDGFIEGWHDFFDLPQGNRGEFAHDRLLFSYARNGEERLRMDDAGMGLGDLRLGAGWQLYRDDSPNPRALALRGSLKLPTGESGRLRGSGSTDLALWLTGSDDFALPGRWGHLALFAAAGGMALTGGDVLGDQQKDAAAFGTAGFGWSPRGWIALKAQFSGHTPFYRGSALQEIAEPAAQFVIGGTLGFGARTALDIAVSEDVSVAGSPDVALHLGLSRRF